MSIWHYKDLTLEKIVQKAIEAYVSENNVG